MRFHRFAALYFTVSVLVFAQNPQIQQAEPLRIKGVYLGQTVQDYLANSSAKARYARFELSNCSKASNVRDGFGPSDRELCEQFAKAAAGEKITIWGSFKLPGQTTFEHGIVTDSTVIVLPDSADPLGSPWDKVLFDLKKKIGEPNNTTPVVSQNGFGAKFTYRSACWTLGEVGHPSYVCSRENSLDKLTIVLITQSSRGPADRERELANKPSVID